MAISIDHIAIRVVDPEKTAAFLEKIGYEVTRRTAHHGVAVELQSPEQPGLVLELTALLEHNGVKEVPGIDHIAFGLDSEEAYTGLADQGYEITDMPHIVKVSNRKVASYKDVDGVKWQFIFKD